MKRILPIISLSLTVGILSGFSAIPPENWEKLDPDFHLTPPQQETAPNTYIESEGTPIFTVEPSDGTAVIPAMPEETGPRVILLN